VDVTRFDELLEEVELENEETPVDAILVLAEDLRVDMMNHFSELGFREADITCGGVDLTAYWEWSFAIGTDGENLDCSIVLFIDGEENSTYVVEVSSPTRAWATRNTAPASDAPQKAFNELSRIFALIAGEQETQ
jgi:hypothetical protein